MPVEDSPLTRASLLVQLRDGSNHGAWREFVRLYGPIVYGFARKRGLQDADAADLMQDVMRSVSGAIGRLDYDRRQGTFRGWLFTITRNKVFNFLSARRIRPQGSGDSATHRLLDTQADSSDGSESWELEYERRLAALAIKRTPRRVSGKDLASVLAYGGRGSFRRRRREAHRYVDRGDLCGQESGAGPAERRSRIAAPRGGVLR